MNFNESLAIKYKITKNGFASKHFCFTPEFRAGSCEGSWCAGTYFNCIMFMVASSVVTTIMVLNYHHRMVDTHDMPDWVKIIFLQVRRMLIAIRFESSSNIDNFEPKNCQTICFTCCVQWMPWLLRMSRPGEKITRKTIQALPSLSLPIPTIICASI